ncbi:hypothetical protein DC20_01990 [Rufibacter tibetensis]|uniref:DUF481 domain-containing protein n=2 Tax=Rufibacter tibetensis TaxID=512763 RepID=A0A0P0CG14_9BACT|nr:hypothetical protein DC20_01990 [Rufibacter tibetensis]
MAFPALAETYPLEGEPSTILAQDTSSKKGWWTVGLETANNATFFGRNTATQYPYVAASLTYTHTSGLFISAMSYQLFNTEDFIDETDVTAGYSFKVGERFDGLVSYSRFFFGPNTPLVKAVTSNAATAAGTLDWKYLLTGLSASYIFGGSSDLFTVLDNSRYIPLQNLWKGKNPVGIDPKFTVIAGTQEFSQTHTVVTEKKKNPVETVLDPLNPIGNNGNGNGNGKGKTTTTTTTTVEKRFKVLNYSITVPLVFSLYNVDIEPAYRFSLPVNKLEGDESKAQSFVSLNLSYTF